jgi:hypothetical protein
MEPEEQRTPRAPELGPSGPEGAGEAHREVRAETQAEVRGELRAESRGEARGEANGQANGEVEGQAGGQARGQANGEEAQGEEGLGDGVRGAGTAGLSLPSRLVVAGGVAAAAVAVAVHIAMVFLHVAPPNTLSKQHSKTVDDYVYPEFEQNWKLFAPNPLQQNVAVQARALIAKDDGSTATTGWTDLTAQDGAGIHHNIAPSHTQQNELRRGWEFYSGSHDDKGKPVGMRGELSESYIKRIVMYRFGPRREGGTVERIQVRSATTPVAPPSWSKERKDRETQYRMQPWWQVTSADLPGSGER